VEPEDVARVAIDDVDGRTVRLGDVALVKWDTWPMVGDAVINDGPGLMLIVEKLPWANTLQVTRGVEAALAELAPGLPGIEIDHTIFRPATFIELSIHNLVRALLIGCVLVVLVLAFFLYEWRAALISVVAIPLSLIAGAMVLYLRGVTINTMVLAGFVIAVGVVVDDAIIDIENIVRRLRRPGHPRRLARGAQRHHLRDADRRRRADPRVPHGRALRRVLPAARDRLRTGRAGLADRRPDGHPGDGPDPAAERAAREARVPAGQVAPAAV
jgi:multidrug efflux pump subunit AcrB